MFFKLKKLFKKKKTNKKKKENCFNHGEDVTTCNLYEVSRVIQKQGRHQERALKVVEL